MNINSAKKPKAAGIHEIPEDLITEILIRTPVKSILKFRCVSKSWCSLISGKPFIGLQLDFAKKNPDNVRIVIDRVTYFNSFPLKQYYLKALLNKSDDTAPELYYPLQVNTDPRITTFCNGLCCAVIEKTNFRRYSRSNTAGIVERRAFMWNPSTRISRELPSMDNISTDWDHCCYGFGFYSDDYKLVAIHPIKVDPARKYVELYSLKSDSWKRSVKLLEVDLGRTDILGKFANGKLYWIRRSNKYFDSGTIETGLFYFDLGTELFGTIETPPSLGRTSELNLAAYEERICLLCYFSDGRLDVWVLKDESSWDKMISILQHKSNLGMPLLMLPEEGGILMKYESSDMPTLVYGPKTNYSTRQSKVIVRGRGTITQDYVTSLVSPLPEDCEPSEQGK